MLMWLLGVNLLYSFLAWMLFPNIVYLWATPILVSIVLVFLSLELEDKNVTSQIAKGFQKYVITLLWFLIILGLGILLYSLGFGVYTLLILLSLNTALFLVSFLLNYNEGKQIFFRGLCVLLMALGFLWVKGGGGIVSFLIMGFGLLIGLLSFVYFILGTWVLVEETYKWYLVSLVAVLGFLYAIFLSKGDLVSVTLISVASQIYILLILLAFWILKKKVLFEEGDEKGVSQPDLEEVIKFEGVSPFFKHIRIKSEWLKKDEIILALYKLWLHMPDWLKSSIGLINFIAFGAVLMFYIYWMVKGYMKVNIQFYMLSLVLFLINTFLLLALNLYRWWYRFLLAFLLNAMGYVIIYYFLNFDTVLLSLGLTAWSFVILGFYRLLRVKRAEWNIFKEDIWIGIIFNTFFVIINVVIVALMDSFSMLQKIGLLLTYMGIYGVWIYYLWKISSGDEEIILSDEEYHI